MLGAVKSSNDFVVCWLLLVLTNAFVVQNEIDTLRGELQALKQAFHANLNANNGK